MNLDEEEPSHWLDGPTEGRGSVCAMTDETSPDMGERTDQGTWYSSKAMYDDESDLQTEARTDPRNAE